MELNGIQRRHLLVALALIAVLLGGCSDSSTSPEPPRELTRAESQLVEADNSFGLNVFRRIVEAEPPDRNVFISPTSIAMALGMTLNGAEGATRDSMQRTLALDGISRADINASYRSLIDLLRGLDPAVKFQIANSIWYRQGLDVRQEFVDTNSRYFDAVTRALDFTAPDAAETINAWVRENTNGRIQSIVSPPIPDDLVMFLIDAIYFKGDWSVKFDTDDTRDAPFTLSGGTTTSVPMMYRRDDKLLHYEDSNVVAVDLPYGNGLYSMTLVLPKRGTIDSLANAMTPAMWDRWISSMGTGAGLIYLPRFTAQYETTLKDVLSALGMGVAFSDTADFSGIRAAGGLRISEVRHKTFVQVDEAGTEAAAVTSVEVGTTAAPEEFVFRADHPFLYAIRERHSGTILFVGRMMDPSAG